MVWAKNRHLSSPGSDVVINRGNEEIGSGSSSLHLSLADGELQRVTGCRVLFAWFSYISFRIQRTVYLI